ncbi:MAG: thiaminase II [Tannerellaceae bacterium]|jgi:thiaminase/transcriptional activator TenA|nr:thiaminase II [Tannerellaceae bacterium]
MNWSDKAWEQIVPIYNSIIDMPFIKELMNGTLPIEKFQFYIAQDSFYLESYGRALAIIAARANSIQDSLVYIRFAESAIIVEREMHESFFRTFRLTNKGNIEPTCHHYAHFLKSTAILDAVEVGMAAILPCFWIYKTVGDYVYENCTENNPYQKWIDTYAGEEFGLSVSKAIETCNSVASQCTEKQKQAMTDAFVTASRLEFHFWDSAYKLKKW